MHENPSFLDKYKIQLCFIIVSTTVTCTASSGNLPKLVGGTNQDTDFRCMDYDGSSYYIMGGKTTDSAVYADGPIMVLMGSTGSISWQYGYDMQASSNCNQIEGVAFASGSTYIAATAKCGTYIVIFTVVKSSGAVTNTGTCNQIEMSVGHLGNQVGYSAPILSDSSCNYIIGFKGGNTADTAWSLAYVNGKSPGYDVQTVDTSIGMVTSLAWGYGSTVLAGGYLGTILGVANPGKTSLSVFTFTPIGSGSSATYSAAIVHYLSSFSSIGTADDTKPYSITQIYANPSKTSQYIYTCSNKVTGATIGMVFFSTWYLTVGTSIVSSVISAYTPTTSHLGASWSPNCMAVYGDDTTSKIVYALIYDDTVYQTIFMKADILNNLAYAVTLSTVSTPANSADKTYQGKISGPSTVYYVGKAKAMYDTTTITYTKTQGYLMRFDSTNCCVTMTADIIPTSSNLALTRADSSNEFALTVVTIKTPAYSINKNDNAQVQEQSFASATYSSGQTFPTCTGAYTVVASTWADQTYTLGTGNEKHAFPAFTLSLTTCTCSSWTYSYVQTTVGTTANLGFIQSFSSATCPTTTSQCFVANAATSATTYATNSPYSITVTGYCGTDTTKSATMSFNWYVYSVCSSVTITASTINNPNWYIITSAGTIGYVVIPYFTVSNTACTLVYTITYQDGSALSTGPLFTQTTQSGLPAVAISTTDDAYILRGYQLKVTASITGFTPTATASFYVYITDPCYGITITTSAVTSQTYDISQTFPNTFQTMTWATSNSSCTTSTTYTMVNQAGGTVASIFTTTATSSFPVYASTATTANVLTYSLRLYAQVGTYVTSSNQDFTITFTNNCAATSSYTIYTPTDTTYYLGSGTVYITYSPWTCTYTYCGTLTYTVSTTSPTAYISSSLPTFMSGPTYDTTSGTYRFSVSTSSSTYAPGGSQSYTIQLTGATTKCTQSVSFIVTVIDPCASATISASTVSTPTSYAMDTTTLTYSYVTIPDYTVTCSQCSTGYTCSVTYTYFYSTPSTPDSTMFTLGTYSSTRQVRVGTQTISQAGTYTFYVTGTIASYTVTANTNNFVITVVDPCAAATISASTVSTPTSYTINTSTLTYSYVTVPDFTVTCSLCPSGVTCSVTYTYFYNTGATPDSTLFTLGTYSSARKVQVGTITKTYAGTYTFYVTGTLTSYTTTANTNDFVITMIDPCAVATISSSAVSTPTTYTINTSTLTYSYVTVPDFTVTCSYCPSGITCSVDYTYFYNTGATPDSTLFTLGTYSSDRKVRVGTTSVALANTYTLYATGTLNGYTTTTNSNDFVVTVVDPCVGVTITTTAISDYTIDIHQTQPNTFTTATWPLSSSSCLSSVTYTLSYQAGGTVSSIFNPTSSTTSYSVLVTGATTTAYVNTYNLALTASAGSYYTTSAVNFIVTITNNCPSATITPLAPSDQSYAIGVSTSTFTFTSWTLPYTYCGAFSYTASTTSPAAYVSATYPVFMTGPTSSTSTTFTIYTADITYTNVYTIQITGSLGGYTSASTTFLVTVTNPCASATITTSYPDPNPTVYYLGDTATTITIPAFTSSQSSTTCGSFVYSITNADLSTLTGMYTAYSNTALTVTVSTSSTAYLGWYYPVVTGYQSLAPTNSKTQSFMVIVSSYCYFDTITPSSLTTQYYIIKQDGILTYTFSTFTAPLSASCGTIQYTALLSSGAAIPSYLTLSTRTFSLYTIDITKYGTQTVKVTGAYPSPYSNVTAYFTHNIVLSLCPIDYIIPQSSFTQSYTVYSAITSFTVGSFSMYPLCGYSFTYSASLSSVTLPDTTTYPFLSFTPSSSTFTVYTTDSTKVGTYKITFTGTLNNEFQSSDSTCIITLTIIDAPTTFTTVSAGPSFSSSPLDQSVSVGSTGSYTLPDVTDSTGASVTTTVTLGPCSSFTSNSGSSFSIKPVITSQIGSYTVTVLLTNSNGLTKTYTFKIKVTAAATTSSSSTDSSSNSTDADSNFTSGNSTESTNSNARNEDPTKKLKTSTNSDLTKTMLNVAGSTPMKAQITKVSNIGVVTVTFNQQVVMQNNYSVFNESQMEMVLVPGSASDPSKLKFNWTIIAWGKSSFDVQLYFVNPLSVSVNANPEQIKVKFIDQQYFHGVTGSYIPQNYTTNSKSLSRQMDAAMGAQLNAIGGSMKQGGNSVALGNMAMNIILSTSLNLLWSLVNALQILCLIPLCNIQFPANAQMFFQMLIMIASFNVFPSHPILFWWDFENNISPPYNDQFDQMGYGSMNMVDNLGFLFVFSIIFIPMIMVFLIFFPFRNKNRMQNKQIINKYRIGKIWKTLKGLLFFNLTIRYTLESYIDLVLSSWLNFLYLQFDTFLNKFASGYSLLCMGITACVPFMFLIITMRKHQLLKSSLYRETIGAMYEDLNLTSKWGALFHCFFFLRRFLFCMTVIFLSKYPRPFETPLANKSEMFNEIIVLLCSYHLFIFTDFVPNPSMQFMAGWSIMAVAFLQLLVNFGIMFSVSGKQIGMMCKRKLCPKLRKALGIKQNKKKYKALGNNDNKTNEQQGTNQFDASPDNESSSTHKHQKKRNRLKKLETKILSDEFNQDMDTNHDFVPVNQFAQNRMNRRKGKYSKPYNLGTILEDKDELDLIEQMEKRQQLHQKMHLDVDPYKIALDQQNNLVVQDLEAINVNETKTNDDFELTQKIEPEQQTNINSKENSPQISPSNIVTQNSFNKSFNLVQPRKKKGTKSARSTKSGFKKLDNEAVSLIDKEEIKEQKPELMKVESFEMLDEKGKEFYNQVLSQFQNKDHPLNHNDSNQSLQGNVNFDLKVEQKSTKSAPKKLKKRNKLFQKVNNLENIQKKFKQTT